LNIATSHSNSLLRSLQVLLLALLGLTFYVAAFLLLAGLCFLVFSATVHAQPTTGTWTRVGSMTTPRKGYVATLLPDGSPPRGPKALDGQRSIDSFLYASDPVAAGVDA